MKKILLFGAGKSATVLIDYLLQNALVENWILTVVDANEELAQSKIGHAIGGRAAAFDINNAQERNRYISEADLVISLLPPALHALVATDCLDLGKNLLTASYVDEHMKSLQPAIEEKGLLFLCEMGLDPGIDHMSAKKLVDAIQQKGGTITSFLSHCGGLVAEESDNNPWHYKISWNPRNVVLAGKAGAHFVQQGEEKNLSYKELFQEKRYVAIGGGKALCWYPNRDSLSYRSVYGLENCPTFIRTTIRHPDFMYGWKNIVDLHLTDEEKTFQSDGKTLKDFFKEHFDRHGFSDWLQQTMQSQFRASTKMLEELMHLVELEENAAVTGEKVPEDFMVVNDEGALQQVDLDDLKTNVAATVAHQMHEAKLNLKQLFFLGMDDDKTFINKGVCSPADVLQLALEKKLALLPGDRDLVVMVHELEYILDNKKYKETSTLYLEGNDDQHTAMAKTVGLPLGIAAKLILNGSIVKKGLCIPVSAAIYEPVLKGLAEQGIRFTDECKTIN